MSKFSAFALIVIGLACHTATASPLHVRNERAQQQQQNNPETYTNVKYMRENHQQQLQQQQQEQQPTSFLKSQTHLKQQQQELNAHNRLASEVESRKKRSQRDFGEYRDLNELFEELEQNSAAAAAAAATAAGSGTSAASAPPTVSAADFDVENMPPLMYYLLLEKLAQLHTQTTKQSPCVKLTPRLGRSIDFQLRDGTSSTTNAAANAGAAAAASNGGLFGGSGSSGGGSRTTNGVGNDAGVGIGGFAYYGRNDDGVGDIDVDGVLARQFLSRISKKSVPFKPRLGKRAQLLCD